MNPTRASRGTLATAVLLLVLAVAPKARADSWVNCDTEGGGALQHLINTSTNGGTIHVRGTCYGTFRAIHVRDFSIRGPATLDAQHRGPVMEIQNLYGGWLNLENLTIRHGKADGNGGGGIVTHGVDLTIKDSAIVDNGGAHWGGGILSYGDHLVIRNSFIARNRATMGGGVFIHENGAEIFNSVIHENHAESHGGGVYSTGDHWGVDLTHTIVSSNTSNSSTPGVIATFVDIKRSVIDNNRSQAHARGAISGGTQVLVENSSIIDNHGGAGSIAGGIVANSVFLENSTVANNVGSGVGGVYSQMVGATATTFTGNRATDTSGSGGAGAIYAPVNPPYLRASILAGNHGVNPECYSRLPIVSDGYNLVDNTRGCTWTRPAAGDRLGSAATPIDPKLGPIEYHFHAASYTLLPVFPLEPGSPAIDAIPASACPFADDQREKSRPSGAGCDIGSFERHPSD